LNIPAAPPSRRDDFKEETERRDDLEEETERICCSNFLKIGFLTGKSFKRQLSVANSDENAEDSFMGDG
jgi:hypothetical protein